MTPDDLLGDYLLVTSVSITLSVALTVLSLSYQSRPLGVGVTVSDLLPRVETILPPVAACVQHKVIVCVVEGMGHLMNSFQPRPVSKSATGFCTR